MDAVVVRRVEKKSKVIMPTEASVINRSTTPPKVQFVPAHINIWAPQAQQHLLTQHASKGSRPQSAHGTVHKGLPMTAVTLKSMMNVKQQASSFNSASRPSSAPVLTFSRADNAVASGALSQETHGLKMRSQPISDPLIHTSVINDAVKTLGSASATITISGPGDHQQSQKFHQSAHSKPQRPITPDFRNMHSSSISQHSEKRLAPSRNLALASRFDSQTSLQKHTEIETFDSGGESDTETFAHTRLAATSSNLSRPSSSSSKHQHHHQSRRPDFSCSMPASASSDADERKSEIFERFSKKFVKVEDFAAFAGKNRFRSAGVKLEAALLERLQSITQPNARAVIFSELFDDVISKDVVYGSVLRHIKNEYDSLITPADPSELANRYHQLMSNHRVTTADLELARQEVMQLQELLSATRAEVQIRGANIQILEENLAARRRRDVALTIADDEGQTVMESMRRQVEYLTLENERLQKELKNTCSRADAVLDTNWKVDEDGDGMERAAQMSTLTIDAQRPSSASSKIKGKGVETASLFVKTALPSVQAAPLLQFTPGTPQHAPDKYSNDFDFSLKPQLQPPSPPPPPIYNGELLQAPHSAHFVKQPTFKNNSENRLPEAEQPSHASLSQSGHAAQIEPSAHAQAAAAQELRSSSVSAVSKLKAHQQSSTAAATAVPAIPVNIVKAAQVSRPPSAGDRISDRSQRSQNSERSAFSVSEANDGYDEVAELSRGRNIRRVVRPDFVPTLTVQASKDAATNDDDTDSEQSYSYLNTEGEQYKIELSPIGQNFL